MKIAAKEIKSFIAAPSRNANAVLFYGPDSGLARERSDNIISVILGKNYDKLSILDITESRLIADPAFLNDELASVSFFSEQRIILIREASDKLTKIIESASDLLRAEVFVVVLADELSPRSSLRLWFEKSPKAAAVACYHDEARDIGECIRSTLQTANIQADSEVVTYLISQLGNDRYVTKQELNKIITYVGKNGKISLEEAANLVGYNKETDIDEAINALADSNLAELDKAVSKLVKESVQPVQYIRAISRYFQRLYAIKIQSKDKSIEEIIAAIRPAVFFRQVPALTRHARKWPVNKIAKILTVLNEAELACKTSDVPSIAASERFLFRAAKS